MNHSRRISTDQVNSFLLGFDSIFSEAFKPVSTNYPPHNIYRVDKENQHSDIVIDIALAGIDKQDISLSLTEHDTLKVEYNGSQDNDSHLYIHRGIATRKFSLEWKLNKGLEVKDAAFVNGVLHIVIADHTGCKKPSQQIAIK